MRRRLLLVRWDDVSGKEPILLYDRHGWDCPGRLYDPRSVGINRCGMGQQSPQRKEYRRGGLAGGRRQRA
jgi:hypothetical protein